MAKKYHVTVFGKEGCDKCKLLNQRLEALLAKEEWSEFEKNYQSLDTEDGLVAFCNVECINPQRIPAFFVARCSEETGEYKPLENPHKDDTETPFANARLYNVLGLQTDYSERGRGVISPKMIKSVLEDTRR